MTKPRVATLVFLLGLLVPLGGPMSARADVPFACFAAGVDPLLGPDTAFANIGTFPCHTDARTATSASGSAGDGSYTATGVHAKVLRGLTVIAHANVLGTFTLHSGGHTLIARGLRARLRTNCATYASSSRGGVDYLSLDGRVYVATATTTARTFETPLGEIVINEDAGGTRTALGVHANVGVDTVSVAEAGAIC